MASIIGTFSRFNRGLVDKCRTPREFALESIKYNFDESRTFSRCTAMPYDIIVKVTSRNLCVVVKCCVRKRL